MAAVEEANVDESITTESKASNEMENDLIDEQNTKSYEEKMNIDIGNINAIEQRNKAYNKLWRTTYKVIQLYYFKETDSFQDDYIYIGKVR